MPFSFIKSSEWNSSDSLEVALLQYPILQLRSNPHFAPGREMGVGARARVSARAINHLIQIEASATKNYNYFLINIVDSFISQAFTSA